MRREMENVQRLCPSHSYTYAWNLLGGAVTACASNYLLILLRPA